MHVTQRFYYTDQRLIDFTATVVEVEDDGRRVVLNRSAFYPTSGGQLHDTGFLDDALVVDVLDEDHRVVHVCSAPAARHVGDTVTGRVDWERRFHHMQQHSGQHLLSALLADAYGWPTVSVHFGNESSTVDVTAPSMSLAQLVEIEQRVNLLATENHAITVSFEEASTAVGLRKPTDRAGQIRVITINGLDRSACGGTHVAATGEIGAILLRRAERTKGAMRVEFVCGLRAVAQARNDAQLLGAAALLFTAAPSEVPVLVETQQQRVTELERDRKRLRSELAGFEARLLWDAVPAGPDGVRRIALPPTEAPVRDAESLMQAVLALGPCLALAMSPNTRGVMLGSSEVTMHAGNMLKAFLTSAGGRGGGSPRLAQGSIPGDFDVHAVQSLIQPGTPT